MHVCSMVFLQTTRTEQADFMLQIMKLALLLLLCLPLNSLAELPEQIKKDFAPISGVIIMPIGEEYLVDLDASANLHEGDILSLVSPGENVIHPVTKELLGTLDVVRGFLQVTQIKSGYSYAKTITTQTPPQKGDQVKRFEQVPAQFESTQAHEALAEELKIGLPQLHWLKQGESGQPELIFVLSGNTLSVRNAAGMVLKSYAYTGGQLSAPLTTTSQADPFSLAGEAPQNKSFLNRTVGGLLGTVGLNTKDKRLEAPGIIQQQVQNSVIWMGPNLDGNPVGLAVADFDHDGQLETALAFENQLQITRIIQGKLVQLATVDFPAGTQLLSIDAIDTDNNGFPEMFLSAASGADLNSQVVEYRNGNYKRIMSELKWFFRVVELPQSGRTLIAQTMGGGPEHPFAELPFKVLRTGDTLNRGESLNIPPNINLFSFIPFTGTANDLLYAHVTTGDYLLVTSPQGDNLWESGNYFGGTEVSFYNNTGTSKELVNPVYIEQRLLKFPSGEVLVAQNEGPRFLQRYRDFSKSRVVALRWNGFALQESWRTSEQNGYLADFALADADNDGQNELVMAVKYKEKNVLQKGRSTVLIYELNK